MKNMGKLKGISSGTNVNSSLQPRDLTRSSFRSDRPVRTRAVCCPYLDSSKLCCTVDARTYVPNHIELRRYCKGPEHKKCRFYMDLCVWSFLNSDPF